MHIFTLTVTEVIIMSNLKYNHGVYTSAATDQSDESFDYLIKILN